MTKQLRFIAALLALAAVLAVCSSVCFPLLEVGHDCCGENCAVCGLIRVCRAILQGNLLTAAAVTFCSGCLLLVLTDVRASVRAVTPVLLKVKLSD